jgi:hypothetical protein
MPDAPPPRTPSAGPPDPLRPPVDWRGCCDAAASPPHASGPFSSLTIARTAADGGGMERSRSPAIHAVPTRSTS